jgi:hypothetical protein
MYYQLITDNSSIAYMVLKMTDKSVWITYDGEIKRFLFKTNFKGEKYIQIKLNEAHGVTLNLAEIAFKTVNTATHETYDIVEMTNKTVVLKITDSIYRRKMIHFDEYGNRYVLVKNTQFNLIEI